MELKRKVRFHSAEEERIEACELKAAEFLQVPEYVLGWDALCAWVKEKRPRASSLLTDDGWMRIIDNVPDSPLPEEFDFHFRDEAKVAAVNPLRSVGWAEALLSRIDCWADATLKPNNYFKPLPRSFLPMEENDVYASTAWILWNSTRSFTLRVLDLGKNEGIRAIWGLRRESSVKIIERKSYKDLWEKIKPLFARDSREAVLVVGSPGVGKTAFLLYVLVVLLESKKKVLLRVKGGPLYYFEPDATAASSYQVSAVPNYFGSDLDSDPEIHFLADGELRDVPVWVGKSLLVCNPQQKNYKHYKEDAACTTFYLPAWTSSELALLSQEVFPETYRNMEQRYLQWGGKPRHVSVSEDKQEWQMQKRDQMEVDQMRIDQILDELPSLNNLVSTLVFRSADADHPSHKLLCMRVSEGYDSYNLQYASPLIRRAVCKRLSRQGDDLRAFLSVRSGAALHGSESIPLKDGMLHEYFRHTAVCSKKFQTRKLFKDDTFKDTKVSSYKQKRFTFGQPVDVKSLDDMTSEFYNRIVWLENPEEAVDAFQITKDEAGNELLECFRVTISGRGLNMSGILMLKLMDKLGIPASQVVVYIVTTSELFGDAVWQEWYSKDYLYINLDKRKKLESIPQFALKCIA